VRVDGVHREVQLAGDLRPGEVCWQKTQHAKFRSGEFLQRRHNWSISHLSKRTLHRIENVGDTESRHAIGELFSGGHDAISIIKLKDFYTLLEDSLDRCEDVANVIEGIIIKNA